eukprot:TRINITY_DN3133_c0_g1_i1.p1 TRINITY_DN3133_c0_g1~~TRINITY_DN3133_c0_g1_i1.p1  ORF type:complete len:303 (-),score=60.59 TRINITY_DN3133_c0_g1_i1:41-832(-)
MALMLSSLGARVAISSRKADVLEATAAEIRTKTGGDVLVLPADVRDAAAVAGALTSLEASWGCKSPDIVINNAAGNFVAPTERLSANAWRTIIDIVLNGTAIWTLESGKRMIKAGRPGVFLSTSTTYAKSGSGFVTPSAASKAGVEALTKSLAFEWGRYGIRLNALAPGPVETKGAFSRLDPSGTFRAEMVGRLPTQRFGEVEEVANLACYLVSDYASWMTGTTVTLDGGETVALGGEFNLFSKVTDAEWDVLEQKIRTTKGS